MQRVVPAILTDNKDAFVKMVKRIEKFAPFIQIDVMDGKFVPSMSVTPDDVASVTTTAFAEAHLMVEEPLEWLDAFETFGASRILVHYEIKKKNFERIFAEVRSRGHELGIVVNPDTEINEFEYLIDKVDQVLFMSVYPGYYGAEFVPKVIDKIKKFKERFPEMQTAIDGGVNRSNIRSLAELGLDLLCVGSAIGKAEDPKAAWCELSEMIK